MSLRLKFALLFSLLVSAILLSAIFILYYLYTHPRPERFNKRMVDLSVRTFQDHYKDAETDKTVTAYLADYYPTSLVEESVHIINDSGRVVYSNNIRTDTVPKRLLRKIAANKMYFFKEGKNEAVSVRFLYKSRYYYVITKAYDKYGRDRVNALRLQTDLVAIISILLTGLFSFFYVRQFIKPVLRLGEQMQRITENNMRERVYVTKNEKQFNELSGIAYQFNDMLDRLETAFALQKSFVHHASHELRTPLASMLSQTEIALRNDLTAEEAKKVLASLKEDQEELIELTNSLLLLSQYEKVHYSTAWPIIRLDELIYETMELKEQALPDLTISLHFEHVPENETDLSIKGNDSLLKSVFRNLVKNAYLYSENKTVQITMDAAGKDIIIHFDNNGSLLSNEEQARLFLPFFRGGNSQLKKGFGLGLSIVQRIVALHKGSISYTVHADNTNRFTLCFPKIEEEV